MDPRLDFSAARLHGYYEWPYQQIARVTAEAIDRGILRPGDQIPSEKDLMDATGVSLSAARHAAGLLRERGLAITVAHLGTFIAPTDQP
jgi:DNA-binding GntR family transcriptional regulator